MCLIIVEGLLRNFQQTDLQKCATGCSHALAQDDLDALKLFESPFFNLVVSFVQI